MIFYIDGNCLGDIGFEILCSAELLLQLERLSICRIFGNLENNGITHRGLVALSGIRF